MASDPEKVKNAIIGSLQSETGLSETVVKDVAFHMTDWLSDLHDYYHFCEEPDAIPGDAVRKLLIHFLIHVPNHLAAASKLLLDIPVTDVFGVGATVEEDPR